MFSPSIAFAKISSMSVRRRREAVLLSAIAVVALVWLRGAVESMVAVLIETSVTAAIAAGAFWIVKHKGLNASRLWLLGILVLVCFTLPWVATSFLRNRGMGAAGEILLMTNLAWGALLLSILSSTTRMVSLSVIASGFLTLFATVASDNSGSIGFAYLWGVLCLWWLVANHWELAVTHTAASVSRVIPRNLMIVISGSILFAIVVWSVSGRFAVLWDPETELMPTSGGTTDNDSLARSGVGDGDLLVAAREHAASFGPVDSDLFLDSDQPSLFDMYSDMFGEPIKRKNHERTIALAPKEETPSENTMAEAEKSGRTFTTDREAALPNKALKDIKSNAALFWIGRTGVRLGVERFNQFNGVDWMYESSQSVPAKIRTIQISEKPWFTWHSQSSDSSANPFLGTIAEAVKVNRYKSNIIPTTSDFRAWQIEKVEDETMFAATLDGCLKMPSREKVPDQTTVKFVSQETSLDRVEQIMSLDAFRPVPKSIVIQRDAGIAAAQKLARQITEGTSKGWSQVSLVVGHLRKSFNNAGREAKQGDLVDSDTAGPLLRFLQTGKGSDYMFATAAAVMLDELGYETRLVTGFYVDAKKYDSISGITAVHAEDLHAWLEVKCGDFAWLPLEPTPGYALPRYHLSLGYRIRQMLPSLLSGLAVLVALSLLVYRFRVSVLELLAVLAWWPIGLLGTKRQIAWLRRLLDLRSGLIGNPRPAGASMRSWFADGRKSSSDAISQSLATFFNSADKVWFGGCEPSQAGVSRRTIRELWFGCNSRYLKQFLKNREYSKRK